jgi:hypothetical protein
MLLKQIQIIWYEEVWIQLARIWTTRLPLYFKQQTLKYCTLFTLLGFYFQMHAPETDRQSERSPSTARGGIVRAPHPMHLLS